MALHETSVCLRIERRHHRLDRAHESRVDPWRHVPERSAVGLQSQDQRGENALRPGCASLISGSDHDVAVADTEMIPAGAVEMVVAVLVNTLRTSATHCGSIRIVVHDSARSARPIELSGYAERA